MIEFELVPDFRTSKCDHDQQHGCYWCCEYCNYDLHRCGGCGEPLSHYGCGYSVFGTCNDCRRGLFNDPVSE